MKVGIFGGSFDPIHNGHIKLAQYVLEHTDLDEVWLMVSPLNPLKPQGYVATDEQRLEMARLAVSDLPGIKVSDFEFTLPIPSYTYNTLKKLKETHPEIDFRLIIGGDNWATFDRWRNPREILDEFGVVVYPRPGENLNPSLHSSLFTHDSSQSEAPAPLTLNSSPLTLLTDAPQMPVTSTQLRTLLTSKSDLYSSPFTLNSLNNFLPPSVLNYIQKQNLYTHSSTPC